MTKFSIKKKTPIFNKLAKTILLVGGACCLLSESSHAMHRVFNCIPSRPYLRMYHSHIQPKLEQHTQWVWKPNNDSGSKVLLSTIEDCIKKDKEIGPFRHPDHIKLYDKFNDRFTNYQKFGHRYSPLSPEEEIQVAQYILQLMKNLLVHNLDIHETFTNLLKAKVTSSFNPPDTKIVSVLAVRVDQMVKLQRQNDNWLEPEIFVKRNNTKIAVMNYYRNLRIWSNEYTILNIKTIKTGNISNISNVDPHDKNFYLEKANDCLDKFKLGENLETGYYDESINTLLGIANDYISVQEAFQNTGKFFEKSYAESNTIKHIREQAEETGYLLEYDTFQKLCRGTKFIDYGYVMAKALKNERVGDFFNEIQKQHAAAEKSYY